MATGIELLPGTSSSDLHSLDEIDIASAARNLFSDARAARGNLTDKWKRCYDAFRNARPRSIQQPQWFPMTRIPEIMPICAMRAGWKSDQRVDVRVTPHGPANSDFAPILADMGADLEACMDASNYVNGFTRQFLLGLMDAEQYGTNILKTTWDNSLAGGLGDMVTRRVDPFAFYPDPAAHDTDDANFFIEVRRMSLQEIERRFPGKGRLVASTSYSDDGDEAPSQYDTSPGQRPLANPAAISPATSPRWGLPGQSRLSLIDAPGVAVLEIWYRDIDRYQIKLNDRTEMRTDSPWRCLMVAGNVVLLDEPATEMWRHGGHPYDRHVCLDVGEFWGRSMVEELAPLQEGMNRLVAAIQQNIELTGNPILLEQKGSGTQTASLSGNEPGKRLPYNQSAQPPAWLNPPSLPQHPEQLLNHFLKRMEAVSGLSAINQGQNPGGRPSEGTVEGLAESANVRIRLELRNLEHTLTGVFGKQAALICEYYDEPRWIGMLGDEGEPTSRFIGARHFYMPTARGELPMSYNLRVEAGSDRDTARQVQASKVMSLLAIGAMDFQTGLELLNMPNPAKIVKRLGLQAQSILAPELGAQPGKREKARA